MGLGFIKGQYLQQVDEWYYVGLFSVGLFTVPGGGFCYQVVVSVCLLLLCSFWGICLSFYFYDLFSRVVV